MLLLYCGGRALGIVDHLRCRFAHFKLCAHFLEARSKGFNLLLLLRDASLVNLSLLRDGRFLFLDSAVLFQELVE